MSDFVKKVQVDGETKPISLGKEVLGHGLTLEEGKVKLFIDEYSGNWLDLSVQGLFLDSAAIKEEIKKAPVSLDPYGMLENKSHGLALRLQGMGNIKTGLDMVWDGYSVPCVQLDPYGGLEIGDNGIKISDNANAGGGSVTLDPYGGITETENGLGVKLSPIGCLGKDGDGIGLNLGTTGTYNILLGTKTNSLYIDSVELFKHIAYFVVDGTTLGTKATDDYGSAEFYRLTVKTHPDRCIHDTGDGLGIKFKSPSSSDTHLGTDGGLHVDTGTLFDEIASYFGLTPKT